MTLKPNGSAVGEELRPRAPVTMLPVAEAIACQEDEHKSNVSGPAAAARKTVPGSSEEFKVSFEPC